MNVYAEVELGQFPEIDEEMVLELLDMRRFYILAVRSEVSYRFQGPPATIRNAEAMIHLRTVITCLQSDSLSGSTDILESTWADAIMREIYDAICKKSTKYRDEIRMFYGSSTVVVAAIAGSVRPVIALASGIGTALVAALLKLVAKIGFNAFCRKYKFRFGN